MRLGRSEAPAPDTCLAEGDARRPMCCDCWASPSLGSLPEALPQLFSD